MQDTKKLGSVEGRLEAEGSKRDSAAASRL
jgi:hypothetical protein